ncbi:hypothetical protein NDU88_007773 [Pleurodeles waltl]|uniref:Uncharacterized protein n=1 Tax=Pleurodeles waltl TaxID=8319 RepID=A0AAV7VRD7_PLEWA|nr:hypothetical protein NDU88_007773 [Pleurodeles waltl]
MNTEKHRQQEQDNNEPRTNLKADPGTQNADQELRRVLYASGRRCRGGHGHTDRVAERAAGQVHAAQTAEASRSRTNNPLERPFVHISHFIDSWCVGIGPGIPGAPDYQLTDTAPPQQLRIA